MYELRFLGGAEVLDLNGKRVPAIVRQPRRLALLAYVALAQGQSRPRGEVASLFWPKLPEPEARQNLNQAAYFVRKHAPGLLRSDADQLEVPPSVACDVHDVTRHLDAGEVMDAVRHYGGRLLEGLPSTDCAGFEEWLDRRRRSLHERVVNAVWQVSSIAEEADPAVALAWAERGVELQNWSEGAVRRLMDLHVRVGDLGGALEAYHRLSAVLVSRFDESPSAPTQDLARDIGAKLQRTTVLDADFRAISRAIQSYTQAILDGRFEDAGSYLTEGVVYLPPGEPTLHGRDAVVAWLTNRPPAASIRSLVAAVTKNEHMAWARGVFEVTVEMAPGQTLTMVAKFTNTMELQPDGSWKASSVTWNTDGPGPIV